MYASETRLGWALPVVAAAVGGCADPPVLPFPTSQCAFLGSLDRDGRGGVPQDRMRGDGGSLLWLS